MAGVFCVFEPSNRGLSCADFSRQFCQGEADVFPHLSNKKSQVNLLQGLRKDFPIIRALTRALLDQNTVFVSLNASLREKYSYLVPAILFCTNDQSDSSSQSATVIAELPRMSVTRARRMNATTRAMMSTMARTKTGSRRWLLESLRAVWDRSSARRQVPAPRASSSANLTPVSSTDRCLSKPLLGGTSLIANLELEFHVSPIRITGLRFTNRKYSSLFCPPWRIAIPRSAVSSVVAHRPLRLGRPGAGGAVVTKFLIVTPRLEFRAIKTKQTPSSISNRYKMRILRPLLRPGRCCWWRACS